MENRSRRGFLSASAWASGAALASGLMPVIAKAQAIPAFYRAGSLEDVRHVVILMQENRSFDHYFGTLSGVRGFGDPHPAPLDGGTVWHQPDASGGTASPFPFDVRNSSFPVMKSLPHDYGSGHAAWNGGRYDRWRKAKGPLTMGYVRRADIPFHYALADAFTICDSYFSSIHGPTCPNRLFMLTGGNDPSGQGGGPVIDNNNVTQVPDGVNVYGHGWVTYAERLESAGIDWRAYRQGTDPRSDDDSDGGMNLLLAFSRFIDARPGDSLYERGVAPRRLSRLKEDVLAGRLPQVSWLFPPRLFCEHPKWPPHYGAAYIARVLDALTADPDVWSRTVLLVTYDENDGFFDHVVPPMAPHDRSQGLSTADTEGEFDPRSRTPFGLGPRVPMLVISPWSRGGHVCSEVFDHTSILRFLEARFGVRADGITPWRRAVCGDLTSAFDFVAPNRALPDTLQPIDANDALTSNAEFQKYRKETLAKPKPVAMPGLPLPKQEPGRRRTRPLGYDVEVQDTVNAGAVRLTFVNRGRLGAHFYVYDRRRPASAPRRYTVEAGKTLIDDWPTDDGAYDLTVQGPNGFLRGMRGHARAALTAEIRRESADWFVIVRNAAAAACAVSGISAYSSGQADMNVPPRGRVRIALELGARDGWYSQEISAPDFYRKFAGRRETGTPGWSDPAIAGGG